MNRVQGLFCIVLGILSVQAQADVTNGPWSWNDGRVTGAQLNQVVRSATSGRLMAAGAAGEVLISDDDGASWQRIRTRFSDFTGNSDVPQDGFDLHALRWFKGNFIAGGDHLTLLYSADGTHWDTAAVAGSPTASVIRSDAITGLVDYGGLIVASTSAGAILTSNDGKNWNYQAPILDGTAGSLKGDLVTVYFAFYFVVPDSSASPSGSVYGSQDGVHWTTFQTDYPGGQIGDGVSTDRGVNSVLMVQNQAGDLYTTYDFVRWAHVGKLPTFGDRLTWTGEQYALLSEDSSDLTYYLSPDGASWSPHTGPALFNRMFWTGARNVAVGNDGGIYTSADGVAWTTIYSADLNQYRNPLWDGTEFLVYANGKRYAGDGGSWIATPLVGSRLPVTLSKGDTVFLGADASGLIQVSNDGIAWTDTGTGSTHGYYAWAQCGSLAAALSGSSSSAPGTAIWAASADSSSGFATWTEKATALPGAPLGLVCGNGAFVAALSGSIAVSTDGKTWSETKLPLISSSADLAGVAFAKGQFIVIANDTGSAGPIVEFFTSSDGKSWTKLTAESALPPAISNVVWDGHEYLGVTPQAHMWVSDDLLSWYQEETPAGFSPESVAAGGGHLLAAGVQGLMESTAGAGRAPVMADVSVSADGQDDAAGACTTTDPQGLPLSFAGDSDSNVQDGSLSVDTLTGKFTLTGAVFKSGQRSIAFICRASNGNVIASTSVTVLPGSAGSGGGSGSSSGGGGSEGIYLYGLLAALLFTRRRLRPRVRRGGRGNRPLFQEPTGNPQVRLGPPQLERAGHG